MVFFFFLPDSTGEFIRDLVALESGGSGGVVWRIRANQTKLVCAVGSRNGTEETKLLVLDFDVAPGSGYGNFAGVGVGDGDGDVAMDVDEEEEEDDEDGGERHLLGESGLLQLESQQPQPSQGEELAVAMDKL